MEEEPRHFKFLGLDFPLYSGLVIKLTIAVWCVLLMILFIAQAFFQYEMTSADLPGGLVSGVLLAYLISVILK